MNWTPRELTALDAPSSLLSTSDSVIPRAPPDNLPPLRTLQSAGGRDDGSALVHVVDLSPFRMVHWYLVGNPRDARASSAQSILMPAPAITITQTSEPRDSDVTLKSATSS